MPHGGKILIDQLAAHGVTRVFEVPGESFLAALDGLYETSAIETIVCRHEGGAAMMAEATGKLTGRPGIVFATRGPGVVNAISGVYVAQQDATPMILFVGLPTTPLEDKAPFQEIDLEALFSGIAKWTGIIRQADRVAEYVQRAFTVAMSGRPGPVIIGLPEDVLSQETSATVLAPAALKGGAPSARDMSDLGQRLAAAARPLIIVGGPGWTDETRHAVERFAQRFDLPIASSFRCQDYVDNRHPCYVGHLGFTTDTKLKAGLTAADLVIAVGAEVADIATDSYALLSGPGKTFVQVHPEPSAILGYRGAALSIVATSAAFSEALADVAPEPRETESRRWGGYRLDLRAAYEASLAPRPTPGALKLEDVVTAVSTLLPENGIVTNGAGNYSQWVHRYFQFKGYHTGLAPTSGSMGYGLPAAIAAKLEHPDAPVVCFAGDGCFAMTGAELGTAVQHGLAIVILIANNGMFGTIRMHQERKYPGRPSGTDLVNPDFAAFARAHGAQGATVENSEDFEAVFRDALRAEGPFVIDLRQDPDAITPTQTLSGLVRD
ncbi:thiamine pyrophosphate protein [Hyphomicrobium nitrativorans NL23]|uniref:Thiamine pyrophosphate protein n=1 Tax=Hyphomicrobium nitrativorans NL23 TaxID=1029756 RepID=V5SE97_9HYPH|nr:thiamine pyrophosphate-dependent enzyme [Hyphomicrobium nitrativorans]AHB49216.1 thiamine pyrophosphate protein [Hyphomicrobium nitrativorans NL23]